MTNMGLYKILRVPIYATQRIFVLLALKIRKCQPAQTKMKQN